MDAVSAPKILLLGISYPDVDGHMAHHDFSRDVLQHTELSVDQAVECVRRKILTEMDGRDLARCVATEQAAGGGQVFTVSKEVGGVYRPDRHVYASFNNSRGMRKAMDKAFGKVRFQQVILDYYWMPTGWLVTRWAKTLFQETLPDLVKHQMLAYPGSRPKSPRKPGRRIKAEPGTENSNAATPSEPALEEGVVFLPFCAHVCKELVGGIDKLQPYFAITFVKKNELPGHALWKGTMTIDGKIMQERLGKRLDQEEVYCTFQPKDIYESMEDAHVNKDEVMELLLSIEDFPDIRMIRLRPLRQHEPPSVFREARIEPETGGFIGLNREMGRKRFKEWRKRKNKPSTPPKPPTTSQSKAKRNRVRVKKEKVVDSESEVATEDSDEGYWDTTDTESGDSSDGGSCCDDEDMENAPRTALTKASDNNKPFDPCDPARIPKVTHYYPYPALDMESYLITKEVVDNDNVMTYYAKQWGPKFSRKKNKKQSTMHSKQSEYFLRRFRDAQKEYMSRNPRLPVRHVIDEGEFLGERSNEADEGYTWTLIGSDDENDAVSKGTKRWGKHGGGSGSDDDEEHESHVRIQEGRQPGWKLTLRGEDPLAHLEPRIVQLAKRDYVRIASRQLFEMKNPGYDTMSRAWVNESSFMSCYKIPKESILIKMDTAERARKKFESKLNAKNDDSSRHHHYIEEEESVSDSDGYEPEGEEDEDDNTEMLVHPYDRNRSSSAPITLSRLADLASKAPVLSEEFLPLCRESKGLVMDILSSGEEEEGHETNTNERLPAFRATRRNLPYNLTPRNPEFLRELFQLLRDAPDRILDHVLCWDGNGRSFSIKDPELFESLVLHRCIVRRGDSTNPDGQEGDEMVTHRSFRKTLIEYGFSVVPMGSQKTGYRHRLFRRDKPKRLDRLIQEGTSIPLMNDENDDADPVDPTQVDGDASIDQEPDVTKEDQLCRKHFISKLYQLLRRSKICGFGDVIYWEESGKSFKVHKLKEKFSKRVLSECFSMGSYRSFKKELLDRGFRCKEGTKYGIFEHPSFVRGQRNTASDAFDVIPLMMRKPKAEPESPEKSADTIESKLGVAGSNSEQVEETPNDDLKNRTSDPEDSSNIDGDETKKKQCPPRNKKKRESVTEISKTSKKQKDKTKDIPLESSDSKESELVQPNNSKKRKGRKANPPSIASKKHKAGSSVPIKCLRNGVLSYGEIRKDEFERKLFEILNDATDNGFSDFIRWTPKGDAIFIAEGSSFVKNFLHKHTDTKRWSTFEKQLKYYKFRKNKSDSSGGSVYKKANFFRPTEKPPAASSEERLFPTITSSARGNSSQAHSESQKAEKASFESSHSDAVRISSPSSQSETLISSQEKENSSFPLGTGSVAISPVNAVIHADSYVSSPSPPTERQLWPLSDAKRVAKPNDDDMTAKVPEGKAMTTKSFGRPGSRVTPGESTRTKKRVGRPKGKHNKAHKKNGRTKIKDKNDPSRSRRARRSQDGDSARGTSSGSKVCGTNSKTTISPRHFWKVSESTSQGNNSSVLGSIGGTRDQLMSLSPATPVLPDKFPPATPNIGRQITTNDFGTPNAATLNRTDQVLTISTEAAASMIPANISPPQSILAEMANLQLPKKLADIGLSIQVVKDLAAAFVSKFGNTRAAVFTATIFWHAGVPTQFDVEINLIARLIPFAQDSTINADNSTDTTNQIEKLMCRCLLVERCIFQLVTPYNYSWYQRPQWEDEVVPICSAAILDLKPILEQMMQILMEDESRRIQKAQVIEVQMRKQALEAEIQAHALKEERVRMLGRRRELLECELRERNTPIHHQNNANSSNSIIDYTIDAIRRSKVADRHDIRHYNSDPIAENLIIAAMNTENGTRTPPGSVKTFQEPMMQQLCMHQRSLDSYYNS